MKPILFNTEMVRAILDGRKSVTRRVVKPQPRYSLKIQDEGYHKGEWNEYSENPMADKFCNRSWAPQYIPPCRPGDILYVRETFCGWYLPGGKWEYCYKATDPNGNRAPTGPESDDEWEVRSWRPSIHMPKEAARLFLRVTDVRVERLHDMQPYDIAFEGFRRQRDFVAIWDSTIKKVDLPRYGWDANPWVWVISFDRIKKPLDINE